MDTPETKPQEQPPAPPMTPQPKWLLFAAGLLGWYLVNGLIWLMMLRSPFYPGWLDTYGFPNLILLPLNLIILVVLAIIKRTRMIAFGILAALALNIVISLVIGLQGNAWCFVPFFIPP